MRSDLHRSDSMELCIRGKIAAGQQDMTKKAEPCVPLFWHNHISVSGGSPTLGAALSSGVIAIRNKTDSPGAQDRSCGPIFFRCDWIVWLGSTLFFGRPHSWRLFGGSVTRAGRLSSWQQLPGLQVSRGKQVRSDLRPPVKWPEPPGNSKW